MPLLISILALDASSCVEISNASRLLSEVLYTNLLDVLDGEIFSFFISSNSLITSIPKLSMHSEPTNLTVSV